MVTALENQDPIRRIPSWDHIRPISPNQPVSSISAAEEKLLMDQLAGLGYIDDATASAADLAAQAAAELRYNRVASLAQASLLIEASSEASSLADDFPSVIRYRLKAIQVLLMQGNLPDAKAALLAAESLFGPSEPIARMKANLLAASGQPAEARLALDALPTDSQLPAVHEQSGSCRRRRRTQGPRTPVLVPRRSLPPRRTPIQSRRLRTRRRFLRNRPLHAARQPHGPSLPRQNLPPPRPAGSRRRPPRRRPRPHGELIHRAR